MPDSPDSTEASQLGDDTVLSSRLARKIVTEREQSAVCTVCGQAFEGGWALAAATRHVSDAGHVVRGTYSATYLYVPIGVSR